MLIAAASWGAALAHQVWQGSPLQRGISASSRPAKW